MHASILARETIMTSRCGFIYCSGLEINVCDMFPVLPVSSLRHVSQELQKRICRATLTTVRVHTCIKQRRVACNASD